MSKVQNLKITVFSVSVAAVALISAPVMANDMINNQASGYVGGDIRQEVGAGNSATLEVGSISAERAENNTAQGQVSGQVYQSTGYGQEVNLTAQVGSIKAREAYGNTAMGYVDGDIVQETWGDDVEMDVRVGSIDAGDGIAWENHAEGYVQGSVLQYVDSFGKASARVGSIGPN